MKKIIKIVFNISFVVYLFALVFLLFLDTRGFIWSDLTMKEYIKNSSNFVPFKTINTYIRALFDGSMNIDIPIKNLFGNLFMFLPAGIYLPYYIRKLNKISVFLISMSIFLVVIEVVQVVTRRGSFDIDDFILNMLGSLTGFVIWKANAVQKLLR
ncbi:VanZ family protein [Sporosarcina luteola]|uniref:VanZ family protein n=1 Tax=Sporosarcina luteola TaxID=582850 RepID=UPI00203D4D47|nr:VanZ family protein [Sporosarcina luteola]MCM3744300.1 VanZ family protein [Sporosarcina luteola]